MTHQTMQLSNVPLKPRSSSPFMIKIRANNCNPARRTKICCETEEVDMDCITDAGTKSPALAI